MRCARPSGIGGLNAVGLNFAPGAGLGDAQTRTWNVDVFTSWTFLRSFALYGRLGYGQSEATPALGSTSTAADRRPRAFATASTTALAFGTT